MRKSMYVACQQPHSRSILEGNRHAGCALYPTKVPLTLFGGWCSWPSVQPADRLLAEIMASASGFLPGWDTLKVISKMPPLSLHAGAKAVTTSST